jgi:hypothetical protein
VGTVHGKCHAILFLRLKFMYLSLWFFSYFILVFS